MGEREGGGWEIERGKGEREGGREIERERETEVVSSLSPIYLY